MKIIRRLKDGAEFPWTKGFQPEQGFEVIDQTVTDEGKVETKITPDSLQANFEQIEDRDELVAFAEANFGFKPHPLAKIETIKARLREAVEAQNAQLNV